MQHGAPLLLCCPASAYMNCQYCTRFEVVRDGESAENACRTQAALAGRASVTAIHTHITPCQHAQLSQHENIRQSQLSCNNEPLSDASTDAGTG